MASDFRAQADEPLLIGARAAALRLSISERSLWRLTNSGEIPCIRIGRRTLFSVEALRAWIAARSQGARP